MDTGYCEHCGQAVQVEPRWLANRIGLVAVDPLTCRRLEACEGCGEPLQLDRLLPEPPGLVPEAGAAEVLAALLGLGEVRLDLEHALPGSGYVCAVLVPPRPQARLQVVHESPEQALRTLLRAARQRTSVQAA